ncbi:unnamed protein product [Calicophoron daubneyi]|uniref:Lipase n=1 Tax=Calicophoron daubneyi TaxID=300641 RepID=A0AAV2TIN8_CALDB
MGFSLTNLLLFLSTLGVRKDPRRLGSVPELLIPIQGPIDPEVHFNLTEVARFYGYDCEEHSTITHDGYILGLFRIRNKLLTRKGPKKVVLLQHGLVDSAHTWVNNLRNESLGFILADAGFDVWLGNSRGNTYSRRHQSLNPSSVEFWDFSWDHMALYDLPATIYYILNQTKVDKIGYVGHSQGTQIAFAQFSRDPELQKHISVFIALAPVAFLSNIESPIRFIFPACRTIERAVELFGHGEFLPHTKLINFLAYFLCGAHRGSLVCRNIIYLFTGYDAPNTNQTRLPIYISHTPAGTSAQNIVHYCQAFFNRRFRMFDYGRKMNMERYGQPTPPDYDLSKFSVPVAMYSGGHDWLAVTQDVEHLISRIKGTVISHVHLPHYNHLDFVWGMDAGYKIYPHILQILLAYASAV